MINDVRETVVEGGGPGGWGGCGYGYGAAAGGMGVMGGFLLLVVVLIVLFAAFRRDGFGGHDGGHHGHGHGGCGYPYPPATTPVVPQEIATLQYEGATQTGKIIHALDNQTCAIQMRLDDVIHNQDRLALEAQKMFYVEKTADLREKLLCQQNEFLQKEMLLTGKLNQVELANLINLNNGATNHRLDQIECRMVKEPPFQPLGGINAMNFCSPCGFGNPFGGFDGGRRRDCDCDR